MNTFNDDPSISSAKQIDAICDRFELAWLRGERLSIEKLLIESPPSIRSALSRELAVLEMQLRRKAGEDPRADEYASYLSNILTDEQEYDLGRTTPATTSEARSKKHLRYFGDFELLEKVASGGMGTVYRAKQLSLGRVVAIKMINRGQLASELEIRRFYAEAKAAASLDHPNIVPVYEVGEFEGDHFYSMAFVDGQSLAELLKPSPMEIRLAAELLQTVASAVQYAHDQGVIHRDLKPSNILLDLNFRPRVTDFGLAKQLGDSDGITASGEILGTPSFMAPEQAAGCVDAVGFASDIYSLGAVLYTCVSGRPPFQAASQVATLKQVIENEPVFLRQLNAAIPRDLETIVHKCLDKSIHGRYRSAGELAADLERFLFGQPILARPVNALERSARWCRRNPSKAMNVAGLVAFVLAAVAGWFFLRAREQEISLQEKASSAVQQLNIADESELPELVAQVRQLKRATELLDLQFKSAPIGSPERYRAALGLLPGDDAVLREVCHSWLDANWTEWNFIRDQLATQNQLVSVWAQEFDAASITAMDDFRLARFVAIKATIDDTSTGQSLGLSSSDWERITAAVMQELLRDPSQLTQAAKALTPIRMRMEPLLSARTDYSRKDLVPEASIAARLMAEFFLNYHDKLIEISATSKSEWLPVLFGKSRNDKTLRATMLEMLKNPIHQDDWNRKIADCRRRAIAATTLFSTGDSDSLWPLLFHREDTTVRSLIIEWIPTMQREPSVLVQKARELMESRSRQIERVSNSSDSQNTVPNPWLFDDDSSLLRAVLKTLGNYPSRVIQRNIDDTFWSSVLQRYELDPDPGIHSTCEWLLRLSGRESEVNEIRTKRLTPGLDRGGWRVTNNGHVMAVLQGPIEYEAGADVLDPFRNAGETIDPVNGAKGSWSEDNRHGKKIDRSFMIALCETKLSQMHACDPTFHELHNKTLGPKLEHPACRVSWKLAATYCNWLSQQEAIPEDQWCFIKSANGELQPAPDYLHRQGYRLPSEAEWEYACRAGTSTRTYLGDSEELLLNNFWFVENSKEKLLAIPGSFKCNGLGLFDTLGNVQEWCMDGFDSRRPGSRFRRLDIETPLDLNLTTNRILRGSSIYSPAYHIRASEYSNFYPDYRNGNTGFRIARTIPR